MDKIAKRNVGVLFVVLEARDAYGNVKLVCDSARIMSQCIKWGSLQRNPRGMILNIALKVNKKLGGTCHTLASRLITGSGAGGGSGKKGAGGGTIAATPFQSLLLLSLGSLIDLP